MQFKDRLKELRKANNLTQKELAENIGLSTITIRSYESGRRLPKADALIKLEKYFNVSGAFLRGETNQRNSSMMWDDPEIADLTYSEIPNVSKNIFKLLENEDKANQHAVYTILVELQSILKSQNEEEKAKALNIAMLNLKAINDTLKINQNNKE